MELLEFESTLIITNVFFKRFLYLLLGLDIGYIIIDTSFAWNIDHYSIVFTDVNVQNLIVGTFSLFIIELVIFFVQRIKLFKSLDLYPPNSQSFQMKFIEFYIMPLIVAFITGLLYIFNDIGNSNFGWLLLSIPAEILFSFLIFEIPLLFLTTEEPVILLILSNSGTTLYSKKFNLNLTYSDQLLGAYLSAVDILGSNVIVDSGDVYSIKFQEKFNVTIKSIPGNNSVIKFCYIYKGISFYSDQRLAKFVTLIQKDISVWNKIQSNSADQKVLNSFFELDRLISKCFSFDFSTSK